jgi:hypothetical protein
MGLDSMSEAAPNTFGAWSEENDIPESGEPSMRLVQNAANSAESAPVSDLPVSPSEIATRAIKKLRYKPGQYEQPPKTSAQMHKEKNEQEEARRIKDAINLVFGAQVNHLLEVLSAKKGAPILSEQKFKIKNKKILEVLNEHGYIDENMVEEGEVGTDALVAASLLVSKKFTSHEKYLLVGGHKKLAREYIEVEIFMRDFNSNKNKASN